VENALQPPLKDVNIAASRMDEHVVYRRNENVVARQVGDDVVIVPIRHNVGDLDSVYTLNEVAARVWALLDGSRTSKAVLDIVSSEYDVSRDVIERDVAELFASLEEATLIGRND
jgi:hypothetical protein